MEMTPAARERMLEGGRRGNEAVRSAVALKKQLDSGEGILASIRAKCLAAMPSMVDMWLAGARGKLRGWPASARIRASELVAGVAGVELEARAAGRPGGPLAELPLGELEGTLSGLLTQVHALQASESKDLYVPNQGADIPADGAEPIESERPLPGAEESAPAPAETPEQAAPGGGG